MSWILYGVAEQSQEVEHIRHTHYLYKRNAGMFALDADPILRLCTEQTYTYADT